MNAGTCSGAGGQGSEPVNLDRSNLRHPNKIGVERPDLGLMFGRDCSNQQVRKSEPMARTPRSLQPFVEPSAFF